MEDGPIGMNSLYVHRHVAREIRNDLVNVKIQNQHMEVMSVLVIVSKLKIANFVNVQVQLTHFIQKILLIAFDLGYKYLKPECIFYFLFVIL